MMSPSGEIVNLIYCIAILLWFLASLFLSAILKDFFKLVGNRFTSYLPVLGMSVVLILTVVLRTYEHLFVAPQIPENPELIYLYWQCRLVRMVAVLCAGILSFIPTIMFYRWTLKPGIIHKFFRPPEEMISVLPSSGSFERSVGFRPKPGTLNLLEYTGKAGYDRICNDFILEGLASNEPCVLITPPGVWRRYLSQMDLVKYLEKDLPRIIEYSSTADLKTPPPVTKTKTMTIASDPEIMATILYYVHRYYSKVERSRVLIDSVSDLLLLWGFDKTYRTLRRFQEMMKETNSTILFLIDKEMHKKEEISAFEKLSDTITEIVKEGRRERILVHKKPPASS